MTSNRRTTFGCGPRRDKAAIPDRRPAIRQARKRRWPLVARARGRRRGTRSSPHHPRAAARTGSSKAAPASLALRRQPRRPTEGWSLGCTVIVVSSRLEAFPATREPGPPSYLQGSSGCRTRSSSARPRLGAHTSLRASLANPPSEAAPSFRNSHRQTGPNRGDMRSTTVGPPTGGRSTPLPRSAHPSVRGGGPALRSPPP